jgi:hypothetical protein
MRTDCAATRSSSTPETIGGEDVRLPIRHDEGTQSEPDSPARCLLVDEHLSAGHPHDDPLVRNDLGNGGTLRLLRALIQCFHASVIPRCAGA